MADTNITVQKRRILTLDILMRHFPKAFMKTDKKPLKKGIHLDVLQHIINTTDEDLKTLSKRDIRLSLYSYTNSCYVQQS